MIASTTIKKKSNHKSKVHAKKSKSEIDAKEKSKSEIDAKKKSKSKVETAKEETKSEEEKAELIRKKRNIADLIEKKPFNSAFVNSVVYAFEEKEILDEPADTPAAETEGPVKEAELEATKEKTKVRCYQITINNQLVMKRSDTHFTNISSIMRCLSLPKKKRKQILEKFKKYNEKSYVIDNGFFAFQGLWVPEDDAKVFSKTWKCYDLLAPLFDYGH